MNLPNGIILSCSSYELSQEEIKFFKKIKPFGFILFKRNFKNKKQIIKLIKQLKETTLNPNLLIFIDQEGGKVQRLNNEEFTKFPPQKIFGDIYKKNKKNALSLTYKSSYLMGHELKQIGVDVNFSPVCDLLYKTTHEVIGNRSFGVEPNMVLKLSEMFCMGLTDSGIIPVPKHFPGHGRSSDDTHHRSSVISTKLSELEKTDFIPFNNLKNHLFVMLAHITYSDLDKNVATYSKQIIKKLLREKFNFKGLVISDDISMKGISGSLAKRVEKSYSAGCDIILYCHGKLNEIKKIYNYTKLIDKDILNFFTKKLKNSRYKEKNFRKYAADLINYGLIKNKNAT